MRVGVVGCGNLGSSLVRGFLKSGSLEAKDIFASDFDEGKLGELQELGVETTTNNQKVGEDSDVIFVAVKPSLVGEVLEEMKISEDKLLVSVAAGVSIDFLEKHTNARVIRIMPNICGRVAEMASCYVPGTKASDEDVKLVRNLLGGLGIVLEVKEEAMNAVTGLSGSGPAFVYMSIEGLKEAGVELGLPEEVALKLAAQTVKGAGEMILSSKEGLEELIDMVCSPKGTTIEGVKVLRERGVSKAFKEAVRAATKRSEELSK